MGGLRRQTRKPLRRQLYQVWENLGTWPSTCTQKKSEDLKAIEQNWHFSVLDCPVLCAYWYDSDMTNIFIFFKYNMLTTQHFVVNCSQVSDRQNVFAQEHPTKCSCHCCRRVGGSIDTLDPHEIGAVGAGPGHAVENCETMPNQPKSNWCC